MVVDEPVAFWEMWRGSPFPETGEYKIDGALNPVSDRSRARQRPLRRTQRLVRLQAA
jgi:hypothetical protein